MEYQHWKLEIKGHIVRLILNRPKQKNRLGALTFSELKEITEWISENEEIWVVLLDAEGPDFSAGVDVSLIAGMIGQDKETYENNLRASQSILDAFEALEKPTIACLKGHCVGGGVILAMCCDFRIAASNTIFSLPEVKRSIGVIMGTQRITRVAGIAACKEMVMLGNPVPIEKAIKFGMVHEVVEVQDLSQKGLEFAQQFLELPPLAVGVCKRIINEGQFLERAGQDLEIEAQAELLDTEDFQEAISSFFEKRRPVYKGN